MGQLQGESPSQSRALPLAVAAGIGVCGETGLLWKHLPFPRPPVFAAYFAEATKAKEASSFAKRISGAFSLKGGIVGALVGGGTAALATKLNAAGEAGNTANARIQSVARSMGLFGEEAGGVADRLSDLAEKTHVPRTRKSVANPKSEIANASPRTRRPLPPPPLINPHSAIRNPQSKGTAFQRLEEQSRELEAAQVDPVSGLAGKKPSPLRRTRFHSRPSVLPRRRNRLARGAGPVHAAGTTRSVSTLFVEEEWGPDALE